MKEFIGIPWKQHGRDYDAVDCLGIVYLWYRDVLGINIEEFGSPDNFANPRTMAANEALYKHFKKIDSPEKNAVVIVPNSELSVHVGVIVDDDMLLHCPIKHMSCIERLSKSYRNADKRYFQYEAS